MPLQQLVEYFNDRFNLEHQSSFRPILLEDGLVSGLFGPVRINSKYTSLRQAVKPEIIIGYSAQIAISTYDPLLLQGQQLNDLLDNPASQGGNFESIVNFDRLSRTVHMLNYLPISHLQHTLFLEVDPRHILSVKKDHGAYFEEVIHKCGLETRNVVIVTGVFNSYTADHYQALQKGLDNYRQRGYQIALRFTNVTKNKQILNYIGEILPNYVSLSVRNLENEAPQDDLLAKLQAIKASLLAHAGQLVLQQIHEKRFDQLAREAGADLVEGNFYRAIAFDYRRHLKLANYNPAVFNY